MNAVTLHFIVEEKISYFMTLYFCIDQISYIPFVAVICVFGVGWSISVAMMTTMTTSTPTV